MSLYKLQQQRMEIVVAAKMRRERDSQITNQWTAIGLKKKYK